MDKGIEATMRIMLMILFVAAASACNGTSEASEASTMRIRITIGDIELTTTMLDNDTSRDFMAMLPMTLQLKDYANTEKVSDLPRRLSTNDAPAGYDPSIGDITLYAPWGNLAIFYKDFGYAKGLVKLGRIDSGIEHLASKQADFEARFEIIR